MGHVFTSRGRQPDIARQAVAPWKVYGPDLNGQFGGLQGTGGLEATILDSGGTTQGVINDQFGNGVASVSGGSTAWFATRVGAYGPLPGTQAATLTDITQLAAATAWRGRRIDPTGFYNLGARYYEPTSGRFLSADPIGQAASPSSYDFAGGDPVNFFDPDGRCPQNQSQNNWGQNNQAPNSGTTSSSGYTDAQVAAILASGSTVSTAQPCIMCHGMTADGQTGAVTQFAGLSAIPGSGPNAQLGYSVEANLTAGAVLTLGPGIAGGVTALGATAVLPDGMGIGIIQNGQVIAADLTVSTSHAALAAEAGVLGADGTLTGGAQAVTWTVENGQITTMASINFPSQTAGTQAAIRAYLTGLLNGGTP